MNITDYNDPLLIKMIENSVKLDTAIKDLQDIKLKQDMNHVIALALQEHETIKRVDTLWDNQRQLNGSLRLIRYFIMAIGAAIPILIFTHQVYHWPA